MEYFKCGIDTFYFSPAARLTALIGKDFATLNFYVALASFSS